jgi:hypothetical protein
MRYFPSNRSVILKDLLQGDDRLVYRPEIQDLSQESIQETLQEILVSSQIGEKESKFLLSNLWKVTYRIKPPSIEEFLTEEWIGVTARNLWPHVKEVLNEYWMPDSPYRSLLLASSIGTGKSFMSTLSNLYIIVNLWCMRDPKKFFR